MGVSIQADQMTRVIRAAAPLLLPAIATSFALLPDRTSTTNAAMAYLLAVVLAALAARLWGGLVASFLSFLGLNFFFTPPYETFAVQKTEDVIALVAFLLVSSLVATLFTTTLKQRARAERREHEAWLLYQISSRLLRGAPVPEVLEEFARNLTDLFRLARCDVNLAPSPGSAELKSSHLGEGKPVEPAIDIPLRTERGDLGFVKLTASEDAPLGEVESALAEAFTGQLALALEAARLADEARRSQTEAEASRIRAALFSSVTHDLRTPLASIKGAATSLLEEGVTFAPDQTRDLLQTVVEESDRLNRLIANLLDLSRFRAGALSPQKIPTAIDEVIEGVVGRLRKSLDSRPIHVRVREDIPLVPLDLLQIDQVLTNVIENAAKYSPSGTPIELTAARWQSWVEIAIADKGPGIKGDDKEAVFTEFFRKSSDQGAAGVGLGLAITRAIVEAHGGTIWIQETPGGGTTVKFRLPLELKATAR
jgi:two-component system sensor histidine kinase KdpD